MPDSTTARFIRALDLRTGEDLWKESTDIVATWLAYSTERDVMIVSNKSEVAAFRGQTGKSLWRKQSEGLGFEGHPENSWDKVIIWKDAFSINEAPPDTG